MKRNEDERVSTIPLTVHQLPYNSSEKNPRMLRIVVQPRSIVCDFYCLYSDNAYLSTGSDTAK